MNSIKLGDIFSQRFVDNANWFHGRLQWALQRLISFYLAKNAGSMLVLLDVAIAWMELFGLVYEVMMLCHGDIQVLHSRALPVLCTSGRHLQCEDTVLVTTGHHSFHTSLSIFDMLRTLASHCIVELIFLIP